MNILKIIIHLLLLLFVLASSDQRTEDVQVQDQQDNDSDVIDPVIRQGVVNPEVEKDYFVLAQSHYEEAEKLVMRRRETGKEERETDIVSLYKEAANYGHKDAKGKLALSMLLADYSNIDKEWAKSALLNLHDNGNAIGHLAVGFMKFIGYGVVQNKTEAIKILKQAADGGNMIAQMAFGNHLYYGNDEADEASPFNCELALHYYNKAAQPVVKDTVDNGGISISKVRILEERMYPDSPSELIEDKLLSYWKLLADQGDQNAALNLGHLYLSGSRGVVQDFDQARMYLEQSALQGDSQAMSNLGKMYLDGSNATPKDEKKAFYYFNRSAELGNPVGHSGVAILYSHGAGVEKNYEKAVDHFTKSAEQGWVDGLLNLGHLYFSGLGVDKNDTKAFYLFSQAVNHGHTLAYSNLALMYSNGFGTKRSCVKSLQLYKKVSEMSRDIGLIMDAHEDFRNGKVNSALLKYLFLSMLGVEQAQTNAAYLLETYGDTIDMLLPAEGWSARAFDQWTAAAKQNYGMAKQNVADYYYYGSSPSIDYVTAAHWYLDAAINHSNAQAFFNYAYLLQYGLGIAKNEASALEYYEAALKHSEDAYFPVMIATWTLRCKINFNNFIQNPLTVFDMLDVHLPLWDCFLASFLLIFCIIQIRHLNGSW